jgi:hypothetical protein
MTIGNSIVLYVFKQQTFGEILAGALPRLLDDYNGLSWKACFKLLLNGIASKLSA